MKLFKGLLAVVLIAMVVVSCEPKKKDNLTKDKTETVEKGEKKACGPDCKKACCAKKGDHKCDENCKKNGCTAHKDADHKCDENCKKNGCTAKGDHKCSDAKCSADCKDANCAKCKLKQAECKVKCAAKKAEGAAKDGAKLVKEGADKLKKAVH